MEEDALMEAIGDAFLEGAVKWRAETILQTLRMGKLDAWIRQAGFADDIETLKSEIDEVKATASDIKGRAIGNRRLARSLAALKQKLYDADDTVDELDYYSLQHQVVEVEGVNLQHEGMHEAARVDHGTSRSDNNIPPRSGRSKKRSKAWVDFSEIYDTNGKTVEAECRHCKKRLKYDSKQGTRVLMTHSKSTTCQNTREVRPQPPSHSSIDDATQNATPVAVSNSSSRNQEPTQITAAIAHPWNKDEISSRIQKITHQLQGIRGDVTNNLNMLGSDSGASSAHHQCTASDPRRRTSSLLQGKVYGRDEQKNYIIKLMRGGKSDSVTVLPIVGIGGTGKTALAQFVYNDPNVRNQFDHMIWVWVSNSVDEMRITREMLDIVPREKHEGLCSLDKLQQVLKTHIESKRVLLILDDVWDVKNNDRLDLILAPFKSDNANGNVILVTTRYRSVAERIGTTEPAVLGALEDDDLRLLLKARAFRDENYEGHGNLRSIGWKIVWKLKGNPLAAVTAGELLRVDPTVGHWNKILKDEDWKLLGLSGGIMSSLKLSYDQLPYHLHQCFSYCSIFPDNYEFLGEELVRIWISQGFVTRNHSSKRLEEIGMDYLADLVNLGYFQQVARYHSSLGTQKPYVVCGLMHDFARLVSRAECGIVDGLQCNDMVSTVQHLAIVCNAMTWCPLYNMSWSSNFKENLQKTVTSVRKLRTLLLIGRYDKSFFQSFKDIFQRARNLRLLQMTATFEDFNSLMRSSVNPTHLRYLKLMVNEMKGDLPQVLSNFCHLQVLDVGSTTHLNVPHGINNLVSLRHLVAASIARIGKLTSLQKLNNFSVQDSNGFQIIELQSMNDLVQLEISQLQNVKTWEEACGAGLRYKRHIEKLHLSWNMSDEACGAGLRYKRHIEKLHLSWNMSDDEYDSDDSNECGNVTSSEPSTSIETEECSPTEVLEGLEPHNNLKHLQISGYNGATSPSWLASNIPVTSLQTLHLENCGEWRILPSLEGLPLLGKLKLSNMPKVKEVSVPSLEELVLVKMPKLERCSCVSLRNLNSCLRVLTIKNCPALKVFDLFANDHRFKIEQKSWLPRLCELIIHNCPLLLVPHPLPSSSTVSKFSMSNVSKFPRIEARSGTSFSIGKDLDREYDSDDEYYYSDEDSFDKFSDELFVLDGKILAFHNLRFLTDLIIGYCRNLTSISFKGLSQLESLEILKIRDCPKLSGFDVPPEQTPEDLTAANCNALPSLKYLYIWSCGIAWEWLSLILQHAPALTVLDLYHCHNLESLQLNSCTALEKLTVHKCESLGTQEVLQSRSLKDMEVSVVPNLKSLAMLQIKDCPKLSGFDVPPEHTHEDLTAANSNALPSLKYLQIKSCGIVWEWLSLILQHAPALTGLDLTDCPKLESLQLYSCTALEDLDILSCTSLSTLEGFQSLGSLRRLYLRDCCGLHSCLEGLPVQDYELCPQLERLYISGFSFLTTSFCRQLTSLQCLEICRWEKEIQAAGLTDEQERGLMLLGSLTRLRFGSYEHLKDLPAGLHRLRSLQVLEITFCPNILGLPDLPPSLEELIIFRGSDDLKLQSKSLASSKLKVIIDNQSVNSDYSVAC